MKPNKRDMFLEGLAFAQAITILITILSFSFASKIDPLFILLLFIINCAFPFINLMMLLGSLQRKSYIEEQRENPRYPINLSERGLNNFIFVMKRHLYTTTSDKDKQTVISYIDWLEEMKEKKHKFLEEN